ncbi:MAG TPA: thioredoxin [Chitinophagaceae bacterium]
MQKLRNMETFSKILNAEMPVLVDFHAEWCGPCKVMAPELKKFADSNKQVRVLKVDIDKNRATAEQFNIQGVPTLILFKKGKVLWRQSGAMNAQQLSSIVKSKL